MRRSRSNQRFAATLGLLALLASPVAAQGGLSREGALVLLTPVGARSVGQGQATVAGVNGAEGIWGNPASLAPLLFKELDLSYVSTIVADGLAFSGVLATGRAGVLAATAYLYDYGAQEFTDPVGTIGELLPRDVVLGASYAATLGQGLSLGVTYKLVQTRLDCTGPCGQIETFNASTSAFDVGTQLAPARWPKLRFGLAVRNMGLKLQIKDNAQSDALPTRIHLGAQYRFDRVERAIQGGRLTVSGEIVDRSSLGDPQLRIGTELSMQEAIALRAGWTSGTGDGAGAVFGFGFRRAAFALDFARVFSGLSADAGKAPTHVTLRLHF